MSEYIMVGILPDIAVGLKVSEVTVGNLVSLFAFVYAPVTPLGSALSARFPRFATHMTLIGVFLAIREGARVMVPQGKGAIVSTASVAGSVSPKGSRA